MPYRFIAILFFAIAYFSSECYGENVILDSVYKKLDNTILQSDHYLQVKQKTISVNRKRLSEANSMDDKYARAFECFRDYRAFDNDSALFYLFYCHQLASKMRRHDLQSYCNTLIGHQYVVSGYFDEAQHYLDEADPRVLDKSKLNTYYYYKNHLYREMAMYGYDKHLRGHYINLAKAYIDSVNATLHSDNELYYQRRCISLFFSANYSEAMQVNDEWMSNSKPGTQSYANMAYYRSEIYRINNNKDMQKYWLAIAATNELKSAVMNQVALWNLAETQLQDRSAISRCGIA